MQILVVDDEKAVRDSLDRALRLDGYEVRQAADGRQALEMVEQKQPDAIVLDLMMPHVDGLEVCRRLRALLRRAGSGTTASQTLRFADLVLDPVAYEVRHGDRLIDLTRTEFLLLELFMTNPRQVLTRSQIFERVWGYDFGPTSNSLTVYIGYLRRKLESGGESRLLHTVRGVGYVLKDE